MTTAYLSRESLARYLDRVSITGDVATPREVNLRNIRGFLDGDRHQHMGVERTREWDFDSVLELMRERVGIAGDPGHREGRDTISAARCVAALHRPRVALWAAIPSVFAIIGSEWALDLANAAALTGTPTRVAVSVGLAYLLGCALIRTLARRDPALAPVIARRLAVLLIDAGRPDEALSALGDARDAGSLEVRGDAERAAGRMEQAREAYVAALAALDEAAPHRMDRVALMLGAEGDGLSTQALVAADEWVRIPMSHGVDSLNVGAAAAVAFYAVATGRPEA